MLEPQSTFLFVLLVVAFAGLIIWVTRASTIWYRMLAAVLAFAAAMWFGVLAVNRYFDYYRTWGAAIADLAGPGQPVTPITGINTVKGKPTGLSSPYAQLGLTEWIKMPGPRSHISRTGIVYLPPQYFQPSYQNYRFPVIELIHGQPGAPQDWINVMGLISSLDQLLASHKAQPAVLVLPEANGGIRSSLQCINEVHGPQDMTYLAEDVPADIAKLFQGRVQPPGRGWGVAGYSEGGFCAANMGLQHRRTYGFAAVLSGYFQPLVDVVGSGYKDPFAGNASLRAANTPSTEVLALPSGAVIPQFWLAAGRNSPADVYAAEYFRAELLTRMANVPLFKSGGGHTMTAWRSEVPPMLEWMTTGLAQAVAELAHPVQVVHHSQTCSTRSVKANPARTGRAGSTSKTRNCTSHV